MVGRVTMSNNEAMTRAVQMQRPRFGSFDGDGITQFDLMVSKPQPVAVAEVAPEKKTPDVSDVAEGDGKKNRTWRGRLLDWTCNTIFFMGFLMGLNVVENQIRQHLPGGPGRPWISLGRLWTDRFEELPSESEVKWDPNIRVLAATGQRHSAYYDSRGGYYTQELLKTQRREKGSLEQAHQQLQDSGYSSALGHWQFAPSTPRQLNAWQVTDTPPPRFAILLGQEVSDSAYFNKGVKADLDAMETSLRVTYHVDEANIKRVDNANSDAVKDAIQWLGRQTRSNPNAEVVIYYSGHGSDNGSWGGLPEGRSSGRLSGPGIKKETLQKWINEELGEKKRRDEVTADPSLPPAAPPKVLILLDACHMGSMIAQADTRPLSLNA